MLIKALAVWAIIQVSIIAAAGMLLDGKIPECTWGRILMCIVGIIVIGLPIFLAYITYATYAQ